MTDAPVNHGVLTDKEGAGFPGCRILVDGKDQDQPFTVLDFVRKFLDPIPKKARVCFQTKDGKISKIWSEEKEKTAPAGNTSEKSTSPETPAAPPVAPDNQNFKVVEGRITAIDYGTHNITVKDRAGTSHVMMWPAPLDEKMAKLKQWWFTKITAERAGEFWKVTAQEYFSKPEDWPVEQNSGRKGNWQPRNDRAIIVQCCMKVAADVLIASGNLQKMKYEDAMEVITERAIHSANDLCKAAGVP